MTIHRREPYKDTYNELGAMGLAVRVLIDHVRDASINRDEAGALAEQARRTARLLTHLGDVLEVEVEHTALEHEMRVREQREREARDV